MGVIVQFGLVPGVFQGNDTAFVLRVSEQWRQQQRQAKQDESFHGKPLGPTTRRPDGFQSNPTVAYFTCRVPRTTLSDHCFAIQNDGRDERATILSQEKCEWRLVGR